MSKNSIYSNDNFDVFKMALNSLYQQAVKGFDIFVQENGSFGDGGIENGFALLIKLFGNLSLGFEAFIFFIAFLSITIKFYCFRKMSNDAILSSELRA